MTTEESILSARLLEVIRLSIEAMQYPLDSRRALEKAAEHLHAALEAAHVIDPEER